MFRYKSEIWRDSLVIRHTQDLTVTKAFRTTATKVISNIKHLWMEAHARNLFFNKVENQEGACTSTNF